jgi:hypothetical protein
MRLLLRGLLLGAIVAAAAGGARGQPPSVLPEPAAPLPPDAAAPAPAGAPGAEGGADPARELEARRTDLEKLRTQQSALRAAPADEDQKKQIELLQKQVETMQKEIKLLAEELKKRTAAGPEVEALQAQAATLEARSVQAARRDQELAGAFDGLNEHIDAQERYGPWLPSQLKELFLPSGTNETPLSIYGQFLESYQQFNAKPGVFATPDFAPYFLMQLNDRFLLQANLDFKNGNTVSIGNAQVDWFLTDHLEFVVGRYLTPIGTFNERLNHEWINKLPDVPIMFQQVSPLSSTNGVQFRGAAYLGGLPVKMEYSVYGGNGFQLSNSINDTTTFPNPLTPVADLASLAATDEVAAKAVGGRLGCWLPEIGVNVGASTFLQNGYSPGDKDHLELWGLDANYHKGDWDARFEFAQVFQQAGTFIGTNVRRTGLYAQLAYRPWHADWKVLRNSEVVGMYSMERFKGIDPTALDLTAFSDPRAVPVNRDQWIFSYNYYLYPSMVFKFGYEINHEHNPINLHDNVFLSQFVWAF